MNDLSTPIFHRPVVMDDRDKPKNVNLKANAAECAALAASFELHAINQLEGTATLTPQGAGKVTVKGTITASYEPICGVTLQPFKQKLSKSFVRHYATESLTVETTEEVELPADDSLDPDPIIDGVIDLGAALAEELAVRLDPYPRAPGVAFEGLDTDPEATIAANESPFAKLVVLKDRQK